VEAQVLHTLGDVALREGDSGAAIEAYVGVLRMARHIGDRVGETYALLGLGLATRLAGHHDLAQTRLSAALHGAREVGERLAEGRALFALAEVDAAQGRKNLAVRRLAQACEIFSAIAAVRWRDRVLAALAAPQDATPSVGAALPADRPTMIDLSWHRRPERRAAGRSS